ncbi:hypothetical protein ANACOL_02138, partial [Anaerotruncus colihominis DSM 17241]
MRGGNLNDSEQITAFLQEHWYIASVLIGAVILIGAIRTGLALRPTVRGMPTATAEDTACGFLPGGAI